jgi:hypothetical protein
MVEDGSDRLRLLKFRRCGSAGKEGTARGAEDIRVHSMRPAGGAKSRRPEYGDADGILLEG